MVALNVSQQQINQIRRFPSIPQTPDSLITPKLLSELRVAVEKNDSDQLQNVAHSLKSSSATLGATQMASLCLRLESMNLSADPAAAEQLVGELETVFPKVCTALRIALGKAAA